MWLIRFALRRPITVVVLTLAILLSSGLAIRRAPVDIFPNLGIPVIYVVQPFGGMAPSQMESLFITYYEYHFLYIAGLERIESQSIQGAAMLELYFRPGTDIAQSMAQVVAMTFRATAFMPPGTLPAFILRYDAGSIPAGQLVFSSETRSQSEIQDLALYHVRPVLATLPGVSAPPPFGGKVRTVVIDLDPDRMRSYGVSPQDVSVALAKTNVTLPTGNINVGDFSTIAASNAMVKRISDLGDAPLRLGSGPAVYLHDVGRVLDGADIVYQTALVNGRRTVYMPVTKRADASTLNVVNAVKDALPRMRDFLPRDVQLNLEFDQSVYVESAISDLLFEGIVGALLTGLMVILFLRDWRSGLIVILTIPFSILSAVVALRLIGETINIMTLGGLALAVGILVDEATVAIENIHTHLASGKKTARAVLDAMAEVIEPRFIAMLCVLAVFIPSFFMVGIGRALFPPLSLAVAFAMVASYLITATLLPVLAVWLLGRKRMEVHDDQPFFAHWQRRYSLLVQEAVGRPWGVVGVYAFVCLLGFVLAGQVGTQLFPTADNGQFQLRMRAPVGTRIERTEEIVRQIDQAIRQEVGPQFVRITLGTVGAAPWEYPVNLISLWNSGPQDAVLSVALKPGNGLTIPELEARLRGKLAARFPGVRFSFEAGDIVSQVLNFGSPTPVKVSVSGNNMAQTRLFTEKVEAQLHHAGSLRDVQIAQALDYPTLDVDIDRARAGQFGVTVDQVAASLVGATSSSALIVPNFWIDPKSGIPYRVEVLVPQNEMKSAATLGHLPVMPTGDSRPLLEDIATVVPGKTYGEFDHLNNQRSLDVVANIARSDYGQSATEVENALSDLGPPPRGTSVAMRGQLEQMLTTLASLREGLLLAVVVILLLLAANFESWRDALIAVSAVPGVLVGVVLILFVTGSTLNVQSFIGAIMAIGISVANAVLLVSFARERRRAGDEPAGAVMAAARARLRPVLMTTLAMIAGMIPMASGVGAAGQQTSPLGQAVIGGLMASIVAILLVLPAVFVLLSREGPAESDSLDPDDPDSRYFERVSS
jgi:multidrug efflux pump subunit AcrB